MSDRFFKLSSDAMKDLSKSLECALSNSIEGKYMGTETARLISIFLYGSTYFYVFEILHNKGWKSEASNHGSSGTLYNLLLILNHQEN